MKPTALAVFSGEIGFVAGALTCDWFAAHTIDSRSRAVQTQFAVEQELRAVPRLAGTPGVPRRPCPAGGPGGSRREASAPSLLAGSCSRLERGSIEKPSAMPSAEALKLTDQEFNDLLAYLLSPK